MQIRVGLVQVPQGDPTQVYLSVPRLVGALRAAGFDDVVSTDDNLGAYCYYLTSERLGRLVSAHRERFVELDSRTSLSPDEVDEYLAVARGIGAAHRAAQRVDDALGVLRGEEFYDPDTYLAAIDTIEAALVALSAGSHPTRWRMFGLDYRGVMTSTAGILDAIHDDDVNPFVEYYDAVAIPRLAAQAPDLVGISIVYGSQVAPGLAFAERVRAALPDARVVLGGPAIAQIGRAMVDDDSWFDFVDGIVFSEGESAIVELARLISRGDDDWSTVPNLVHRVNGSTVATPLHIEDLRTLAPPDFGGVPFAKYLSPEAVVMLDVTRGCYWGKCAFCAYGISPDTLKSYREMTVDDIVDSIRGIRKAAGNRAFMFSVDVLSPRIVRQMSQAFVDADLGIVWMGDMRFERAITDEFATLMHRGGARFISMGLESSVQRVMDQMAKGTREEHLPRILSAFRGADIGVNTQFFMGFPTETRAEAEQTVRFVKKHEREISTLGFGNFHLCRGSAVDDDPAAFGVKSVDRKDTSNLDRAFDFEPESGLTSRKAADMVDTARETLSGRFPTTNNSSLLIGAHGLLLLARFGADGFDEHIGSRLTGARAEDPAVLTKHSRIELAPATSLIEAHHDLFEIVRAGRSGGRPSASERLVEPVALLYDADRHRFCRLSTEQARSVAFLGQPTTVRSMAKKAATSERAVKSLARSLSDAGMLEIRPPQPATQQNEVEP